MLFSVLTVESSLLLIQIFNLPGKLSSNFSGLLHRQASNMIMVIPVLNRLREGVIKKKKNFLQNI